MKNWKQILAGFSSAALLLTNVGMTPMAVYAEETKSELESGRVKLTGTFPESAVLTATSRSADDVSVEDGQDLVAAYDLSIKYTVVTEAEGDDEEPTEEEKDYTLGEDETVTITFSDSDALADVETVYVYQMVDDTLTKVEDAACENGAVSFETSSLATFAVTKDKEETPEPEETTLDIASIELSDNIKEDGTIVAAFKDSQGEDITDQVITAAKNGDVKITWNGGNDREGAVSDDTPNKLNVVKDHGSQKTYTASVGDVTSNSLKVDYYDEVQNGGFEDPVVSAATNWEDRGGWAYITNQYVPAWNTSANDEKIEFGEYNDTAHGIKGDYYDKDQVGDQYAELNADEIATLYQDVLTDGGSALNWSLLHHALSSRGSSTTDTMYVVVMSTKEAEMLLDGTNADIIKTVVAEVGENATNAAYTITTGKYKGEQVKVTVWTLETQSMKSGNVYSCKSLKGNGTSSSTTGWSFYKGSYTVPQGQYLTRLFFASGSGSATGGNLLDEVYFDQKVAYTIEYWVWDAEEKAYVLQDKSTTTGRQYPNENVDVDTTQYEEYAFVGSTQGTESGGSNPASTSKKTSFAVSGDNNVMSLYYMASSVGTITWEDEDAPAGTRPTDPADVKITTVVDGKTYTATVSVDEDGNWTYEFEDLPRYDSEGNVIRYDIETEVDNYTTDVDEEGNITYTYNSNVSHEIEWIDGDGTGRPDPEDVKITTVVDGKTYTATVTVDKDGNWSYEFEGLPRYDADGKEISYTIKTEVDGYTTDVDENGKVTYVKNADITGTLNWIDNDNADGTRPETVEVMVKGSNGKTYRRTVKVPAKGNSVDYEIDDLPGYDENGDPITYSLTSVITEDGAEYEVTYADNKTDATLRRAADQKVSGKITWVDNNDADGIRPDDVTVDVYDADGNKVGTTKVTVDADGNWTYSVDDLPKYDDNGKAIEYTIKVSTVDGYEAEIDGTNAVLTHGPVTAVTGTITWNDNDDKDGVRPDDVTITVYDGDGNKVGTAEVTVDEDGKWSYSLIDLPRFDENGEEIKYTAKISTVDGYEAEVDGTAITLTHESNDEDKKTTSDSGSGKHDGGKYAQVDFYLVDDANTQPLGSGVFALYTAADELVGTYTTDANGHIQFPNLKGGSYYLVQLSAPDGYVLNDTRVKFTVDGTPLALMLTDKAANAATPAMDTAAPSDGAAADVTATVDQGAGAAVGGATGDSSNMMLYGAATGVAAILLAVWFVMNRRRSNG